MYCKNCGRQIDTDIKYCPECGLQIDHDDSQNSRNIVYSGTVKRCPKCGGELTGFEVTCSSCGWELRDVGTSNAAKKFSDGYNRIESDSIKHGASLVQTTLRKADYISNFVVPNTKEDLLEFAILSESNIDYDLLSEDNDKNDAEIQARQQISRSWITLLKQVQKKARVTIQKTKEFDQIQHIYDDAFTHLKEIEEKKKERRRTEQKLQIEQKKLYNKELRSARRYTFLKRYWKGLLIAGLVIVLFGWYKISSIHKMIPVGISSDYAVGKPYLSIVRELRENGFQNIVSVAVHDLDFSEKELEKTIVNISIRNKQAFEETDQFPYDANIQVEYHALKKAEVPVSSEDAAKMNYEELDDLFRRNGFINITIQEENDLVTGWVTKPGTVKEVTIDGSKELKKGDKYQIDAEVIIIYHAK